MLFALDDCTGDVAVSSLIATATSCTLRSVLDLTPRFTNEPRSISLCAYVVPLDVTFALMKNESLFAINFGQLCGL